MDFGVLGFDGVVLGSLASSASSDYHTKQTLSGSGVFNKHERSCYNKDGNSNNVEDGCCRNFKLARTDKDQQNNTDKSNPILKSNYLFSDYHPQQKMLRFSCPPKQEAQAANFPCFPYTSASYPYSRNTDCSRGQFTASQWVELEHQALIYKYISANIPIPSHLLLPIRKAFEFAGYSSFSGGLLRPTTLGWGDFHLGYSNSTDPEPGRCRRTDGKKWRCSRDAVPDHKYCERHMNRGRHRSRKPVEGQHQIPGHPSIVTSTTTTISAATVGPTSSRMNLSSAALPKINRMFMSEERTNLQSKESHFLTPKQQNSYEETSQHTFGLVSSDSLLNPSQHNKSSSFANLVDQVTKSHHYPLLQFIDNWPRNNQSDQTRLSNFMSSTFCPNNDNTTLSPPRLSNQREANWVPVSWESSVGGPLGEVLHKGSAECKNNSSGINLLANGWDNNSQSSPTGVLQKRMFGSLSNSSAGSSPSAVESNKTHEGAASLYNNDLGSALAHSISLPP